MRPFPVLVIVTAAFGLPAPAWGESKIRVVQAAEIMTAPGRYPALGRIKAKDAVKFVGCLNDKAWCHVVFGKIDGWVSGSALELKAQTQTKAKK